MFETISTAELAALRVDAIRWRAVRKYALDLASRLITHDHHCLAELHLRSRCNAKFLAEGQTLRGELGERLDAQADAIAEEHGIDTPVGA